MNRFLCLIVSTTLFLSSFVTVADSGTGLEIENPQLVQLVYTIEPVEVDHNAVQKLVNTILSETNITLGQREDAQLFLRVEKHAGQYLLYLDFSRQMNYRVNGKCFTKDGFVWGRYAKNINNIDQLQEDIAFLLEEFVDQYTKINHLNSVTDHFQN